MQRFHFRSLPIKKAAFGRFFSFTQGINYFFEGLELLDVDAGAVDPLAGAA